MSIVLAALDASPTAQSVLDAALRIGELTNADVAAVHITTADDETVKARTDRAHVPLHLLSGPLEPALLGAVDVPDVVAAVIGTKAAADDRRLLGATARYIIERSTKPVVIVPPDFVSPGFIRRLLIPLEGTEASTQPVLEGLLPLVAADVELIVIHVFTESTVPAMLDHPWRDLEILGKEFLSRHLPHQEASIELRHGPVGTQVAEVCDEYGGDLIVLSWSQDSTGGKARTVRQILGAAKLPVLLLPLRGDGSIEADLLH
jgi:nucleotide-binding universal stress UspA family protein